MTLTPTAILIGVSATIAGLSAAASEGRFLTTERVLESVSALALLLVAGYLRRVDHQMRQLNKDLRDEGESRRDSEEKERLARQRMEREERIERQQMDAELLSGLHRLGERVARLEAAGEATREG